MADEKPFYIRQLPKEAQDWLKDKAYKSFIADGDKEEVAQKKAEDFLDEKVYVAEEFYGKDFLKEVGKTEEPKYEVVNDFSIDAIKDNFTPPGAKSKKRKIRAKDDYLANYGKDTLEKIGLSEEETFEDEPKVEDVDTSAIDEKDSGKSEEDDLDLYMKDLDDYMSKNKRGRDDIPVTTRR